MVCKRYVTFALFVFLIAAIINGCDNQTEKKTKESRLQEAPQSAETSNDRKEEAGSYRVEESEGRRKYKVSPGEHILRFSVKLPYTGSNEDVQFRVQQSSLDALGINVVVENFNLEPYTHPIWVVDAREGFMGLQKELFTRINDVWVVSLSDPETSGRLSETEILRRLRNKKYHYMNPRTKRMEISSDELTVYQIYVDNYIAHVDVRLEIPVGDYIIHRQEAYIEGAPVGSFQITVIQSDKGEPIYIEGPNEKIPNE